MVGTPRILNSCGFCYGFMVRGNFRSREIGRSRHGAFAGRYKWISDAWGRRQECTANRTSSDSSKTKAKTLAAP